MANLLKWASYGTPVSVADNTSLASAAAGAYAICQVTAADAILDNTTNLNIFCDIKVNLGSAAWAVTDYFALYYVYSADGTNYDSGSATYLPPPSLMVRPPLQISPSAVTQAVQLTFQGIILRPGKTKFLYQNGAAVALAATGNSITAYPYNANLNG